MKTKKKPRQMLAWAVLAVVILTGVMLDVAVQIGDAKTDAYLAMHKCRLINYSGTKAEQIYECDTGLQRLRDL